MSRKVALLLNKLSSVDPSSSEYSDLIKQVVSAHKEAVKQKEEKELKRALEPPKAKEKKPLLCFKCKKDVDEKPKEEQPKAEEPKVEQPKEEKPKKAKKSKKAE